MNSSHFKGNINMKHHPNVVFVNKDRSIIYHGAPLGMALKLLTNVRLESKCLVLQLTTVAFAKKGKKF